jgi:hypothetical protein
VRPGGEVHTASHVTTVAPFELGVLPDKSKRPRPVRWSGPLAEAASSLTPDTP